MKESEMRPRTLPLLFVVALLVGVTARADDAQAKGGRRGVMTVTFAEKATREAPVGGVGAAIEAGQRLQEGDVVVTEAGGRAEIALSSGTVVRLGESTRAVLREAPPEGGRFRLSLLAGAFWAKVAKLLPGDRFEVETENAVAGVRGTEFRVEVAADKGQPDLLRVYEGAVQVDHPKGEWSHRVVPGHELRFLRERGSAGPQAFDPASEADHPFMKWVREGGLKARELRTREKDRRGVRERLRLRR